jgi:hypothetical protein
MADSERKDPVTLRPVFPEGMPLIYANQTGVVHSRGEFVLLFFQTPPALEVPQEGYVKAYCVAQIVLSPENMRRFVQAAVENLKQYPPEEPAKKEQTE